MIIRGTTPYHSFILPMKAEQVEEVWVTYLQNGEIILDKTYTNGDFVITNVEDLYENASMNEDFEEEEQEEPEDTSLLTIHLSQEDTLKFKFWPAAEKNVVAIQIRALDTDGEAYSSLPIHERVMGVFKQGVIGDESNENGEESNENESGD